MAKEIIHYDVRKIRDIKDLVKQIYNVEIGSKTAQKGSVWTNNKLYKFERRPY